MYTYPEITTSTSRVATPSSTLAYSEYLLQQQWSPTLPGEIQPQNVPPLQYDVLYGDEPQINKRKTLRSFNLIINVWSHVLKLLNNLHSVSKLRNYCRHFQASVQIKLTMVYSGFILGI